MSSSGTFGGAYETYRAGVDAADYPMPGRLIDVGDHSLHINCTGTGSPTVVLEPGLGEPSTAMAWISGVRLSRHVGGNPSVDIGLFGNERGVGIQPGAAQRL